MRQEWVLGLTENDIAYQNVLTWVTSRTTNPCKSGLWDVLLVTKGIRAIFVYKQ